MLSEAPLEQPAKGKSAQESQPDETDCEHSQTAPERDEIVCIANDTGLTDKQPTRQGQSEKASPTAQHLSVSFCVKGKSEPIQGGIDTMTKHRVVSQNFASE